MKGRWLSPEAIAEHQARMAKLPVRTVKLLDARRPPLPTVPPKTTRRKGVHRAPSELAAKPIKSPRLKRFEANAPTEHESQCAVIQWWDLKCASFGLPAFSLFAVPNSGAGGQAGRAGWLKAEGVRAGIPDLFLAVTSGRRGKAGLWIEMKRKGGGRLSDAQDAAIAHLISQGYAVVVCWSAEDAMLTIERYLQP